MNCPGGDWGFSASMDRPCQFEKVPNEHFLLWVGGRTVGLTGVQQTDASGLQIHVCRKSVRLSDVYLDYDMVK